MASQKVQIVLPCTGCARTLIRLEKIRRARTRHADHVDPKRHMQYNAGRVPQGPETGLDSGWEVHAETPQS